MYIFSKNVFLVMGYSTSSRPGVHHFTIADFDDILPVASNTFKPGSVKFQLQIINGWCTSITNVEVTFVAAGFFTINS